jgi:hypothetical protein
MSKQLPISEILQNLEAMTGPLDTLPTVKYAPPSVAPKPGNDDWLISPFAVVDEARSSRPRPAVSHTASPAQIEDRKDCWERSGREKSIAGENRKGNVNRNRFGDIKK